METPMQESPGVRLAKRMLESKRETERLARERYENDPDVKRLVEDLKRRNEERGTPIVKRV